MKYQNEKTGAIIDTPCKMEGAWVPIEKPAPTKPAEAKKSTGGKKK